MHRSGDPGYDGGTQHFGQGREGLSWANVCGHACFQDFTPFIEKRKSYTCLKKNTNICQSEGKTRSISLIRPYIDPGKSHRIKSQKDIISEKSDLNHLHTNTLIHKKGHFSEMWHFFGNGAFFENGAFFLKMGHFFENGAFF